MKELLIALLLALLLIIPTLSLGAGIEVRSPGGSGGGAYDLLVSTSNTLVMNKKTGKVLTVHSLTVKGDLYILNLFREPQ